MLLPLLKPPTSTPLVWYSYSVTRNELALYIPLTTNRLRMVWTMVLISFSTGLAEKTNDIRSKQTWLNF